MRFWKRQETRGDNDDRPLFQMRVAQGFSELTTTPAVGHLKAAPPLNRLPTISTFCFQSASQETLQNRISPETKEILKQGYTINELVRNCPQDFFTVLKGLGVMKLGTFTVNASDVLESFGRNTMLTRGFHSVYDPNWENNWRSRLNCEQILSSDSSSVGWEDTVTLGAYSVNIEDVTNRRKGAVLQILLQKYAAKRAGKEIWEFPVVSAIINYHWQHWARSFLLGSFGFFMAWLTSYVCYLVVYIGAGSEWKGVGSLLSTTNIDVFFGHLISIFSFGFMLPFVAEVILGIRSQGWAFFGIKNFLDIMVVIQQTYIFIYHLCNFDLHFLSFDLILVSQCVLLFTKVQNFGQVLGRSAYFSETFVAVMYDVRYLLFYIVYSSFSASLCIAILYKNDEKFERHDELGHSFDSFKNAMVSTYQLVLGTFEVGYILDAEYVWIKFAFFLGFQIYMTVTVFNLLIAVMNNSYATLAKEAKIRHDKGRAEVIDKLDVLGVPQILSKNLEPFIHFLVVEKIDNETGSISRRLSSSFHERQDHLNSMHAVMETVTELKNKIHQMKDQHEQEIKQLSDKLDVLIKKVSASNDEP